MQRPQWFDPASQDQNDKAAYWGSLNPEELEHLFWQAPRSSFLSLTPIWDFSECSRYHNCWLPEESRWSHTSHLPVLSRDLSGRQPPPAPPSKASVVVVIDGQLLNAVMVRTPGWLGERAASVPDSDKTLSLALWACRPVEPNGEIKTALRNYSPTLMSLADFKTLKIPIAPKPDLWPENLRKGSPNYDLLSNLKAILQETRWDSPTNRFLIIITESSAFPKSSEKNTARIDEQEVKKLADQANVKICAVHVLVPNELMADDQRLAEQQLRVLSEDTGRYHYYPVHKSSDPVPNTDSEFEMVTAYADGIKAAFGQILDQVAEGSRKVQ